MENESRLADSRVTTDEDQGAGHQSTAQHLDYATLKNRYAELGPKRLILTHLGQAFLDRLGAGEKPEFETAEDGRVVQF